MKNHAKTKSIIAFLKKSKFEGFLPALDILENLPDNIVCAINTNHSDAVDKLNCNTVSQQAYYTKVDKSKIEVFRANPKQKQLPASIEKVTIYKKNGLFKPTLMEYELKTDNKQNFAKLRIASIAKDDVELSATYKTEVAAYNPQTEVALRRDGYQFKHQIFADRFLHYGFNFSGNIYFKEHAKENYLLDTEKFNRLVNQPKGIDLER